MKMKNFDGVQIKRQGQARILDNLKDLTRSQQLAFWQKGTEELRKRQLAVRNQGTQMAIDDPERRSATSLPPRDSPPNTKSFDCVEMKRLAASQILEKLEAMTQKQALAYWQAGTDKLRQLQQTRRVQKMPESL